MNFRFRGHRPHRLASPSSGDDSAICPLEWMKYWNDLPRPTHRVIPAAGAPRPRLGRRRQGAVGKQAQALQPRRGDEGTVKSLTAARNRPPGRSTTGRAAPIIKADMAPS